MSRRRCGDCLFIIDNRIYQTDPCPECGSLKSDDEWINLDHTESELAWYIQKDKANKRAIDQLLKLLAEYK